MSQKIDKPNRPILKPKKKTSVNLKSQTHEEFDRLAKIISPIQLYFSAN